MEDFQVKRKAKTQKGKKYLQSKEGDLEEGVKNTLFLRGNKTSEIVNSFMKDLVYAFSHLNF